MIWNIGKKGYEHFIKNNYKADASFKDIFLNLKFEEVQKAARAVDKRANNRWTTSRESVDGPGHKRWIN